LRLGLGLYLMSGFLVVMHTTLRCHYHTPGIKKDSRLEAKYKENYFQGQGQRQRQGLNVKARDKELKLVL